MTVILTLILFPLILGLLLGVIVWATNKMIKKMVVEKHQALEEITTTGQVPREWSKPFEKKISRLNRNPQNERKVAALRSRANQRYLKNLDALTHYVENSNLVAGERTRRVLLRQLAETRTAWETGVHTLSERDGEGSSSPPRAQDPP